MTKQNFSVNAKELLSRFSGGSLWFSGGSQFVLKGFSEGSPPGLRRLVGGSKKVLRWFIRESEEVHEIFLEILNEMSGDF